MFFGRYNTLAEQVNENQKNIKTLADAYEVIANDYSTTFKVLDLSEYSNNSILPPEIVSELSLDNIAIIYKCRLDTEEYKAIYNISRRGSEIEFVATSSQPNADSDFGTSVMSINRVVINVSTRQLKYYYENRRVVDNLELDEKLLDKMTIIDLTRYNNGSVVSNYDYERLLQDNTFIMYKQSSVAPLLKVFYNRRENGTTTLNFYGSVVMTAVDDVIIYYYRIVINKETKVLTFSERKLDRKPSTIVDLGMVDNSTTIPQAKVDELLKGNCVVQLTTGNIEDPLLSPYFINDSGDIEGKCTWNNGYTTTYLEWVIDASTLSISITENEFGMMNTAVRAFTPVYDTNRDGYVLNLKNVSDGCGYVRGGWNTLNKDTYIDVGDKMSIYNNSSVISSESTLFTDNEQFIALNSNYGADNFDGFRFVAIGGIIIFTFRYEL